MDDEALPSVSNRIDRLDNRLKELENQSHGWVAKIARVGIIVGCIGGILGGASTFLALWKWATAAPNIALVTAPALRVYWSPEDRHLSYTWGVGLSNEGEAVGFMTAARAHVEFGARSAGKPETTQVTEIQVNIPFPISIKPADARELEITMITKLPRELEGLFFQSKDPYKLVLEVNVPQPKREVYCIYLGPSLVRDLQETGYGPLDHPDPRCALG